LKIFLQFILFLRSSFLFLDLLFGGFFLLWFFHLKLFLLRLFLLRLFLLRLFLLRLFLLRVFLLCLFLLELFLFLRVFFFLRFFSIFFLRFFSIFFLAWSLDTAPGIRRLSRDDLFGRLDLFLDDRFGRLLYRLGLLWSELFALLNSLGELEASLGDLNGCGEVLLAFIRSWLIRLRVEDVSSRLVIRHPLCFFSSALTFGDELLIFHLELFGFLLFIRLVFVAV
jgi:hypothetical protein